MPGGLWEIKRGGFALDYRITVEKVLTWGQAQAKPFHNQWGTKQVPGEAATSGRRVGEESQGLLESRGKEEAGWPSSRQN